MGFFFAAKFHETGAIWIINFMKVLTMGEKYISLIIGINSTISVAKQGFHTKSFDGF